MRDFNLQEQIDAIDDSISAWEKYKKQWQDVAKDYQKSQDKLMALQVLGADFEEKVLAQRIDILESFKENYLRIQAELLAAQQAIIDIQTPSSGTSSQSLLENAISSITKDELDKITRNPLEVKVDIKPGDVIEVEWVEPKKYASGTRNSPQGWAVVDDAGPELTIGKNKGRYTYLEAGSQVMNANLAKNIFSMAQNPIGWIKDAISKIPQVNSEKSNPGNIISIGDIIINNPVGDSNSFARELTNTLSIHGLQVSLGTP